MTATFDLPGGLKYRPRYNSPGIVICDIVNAETGLTTREENEQKQHAIPIGTLVEITSEADEDDRFDGVRLYVVHHHRDCDGTPLYALAADKTDTIQNDPRFHNRTWLHGMPEYCLKIINPCPAQPAPAP